MKLNWSYNMENKDGVMNPTGKEQTYPAFTAKPSDMVSLYEYYGKAQGMFIGQKVYEISVEDRVETSTKLIKNSKYNGTVRTYPRTWLDKLDFIDRVHEDGAKSDKQIVEQIKKDYEKAK